MPRSCWPVPGLRLVSREPRSLYLFARCVFATQGTPEGGSDVTLHTFQVVFYVFRCPPMGSALQLFIRDGGRDESRPPSRNKK